LQPRRLSGKWLSYNEWVLHTSSEILIQVEMSFMEKNFLANIVEINVISIQEEKERQTEADLRMP
jgi:hypothetical protein